MHNHHFLIDNNLKELTEHSTTTWPIALYHSKIRDHMSGYIPLHWHDEFQFVFILEGEAEFHINEKILNIQQGDGVFINSGTLTHGKGCKWDDMYLYLFKRFTSLHHSQ